MLAHSYFEGEGSTSREDRHWLRGRLWGLAVLDEAHAIKSAASTRYARLSALKAAQRLLLTGTPIQNNLGELLALLSFMLPTVFPPQLSAAFAESAASRSAEHERQLSRKGTASLFFDLRKAANHPCLLRRHYKEADITAIAHASLQAHYFGASASLQMIEVELSSYSDFRLHEICADLPSLSSLQLPTAKLTDSAKMASLRTLLPSLAVGGHRALLFSQSTQMLDILETFLSSLKLSFVRLDGSTPVAERQSLIDEFQREGSQVFAFLLSTRAGGQGINLTAADTVILHDLDWNPQLDRQVKIGWQQDRAHRIGQSREVRVIRMVTRDTVEDHIHNLQKQKKMLGSKVLDERKGKANEPLATSVEEKLDFHTMSSIIEQALADQKPCDRTERKMGMSH
ncbi:MAG: hypothetical protein SGPRY_008434 [Prymnesium sp.]